MNQVYSMWHEHHLHHGLMLKTAMLCSWSALAITAAATARESSYAFAAFSERVLPLLFFGTAFVTRYNIQHHQSRLQILAFGLLACGLELGRAKLSRKQISHKRWLINEGSAAAGVLLVKAWTEHTLL